MIVDMNEAVREISAWVEDEPFDAVERMNVADSDVYGVLKGMQEERAQLVVDAAYGELRERESRLVNELRDVRLAMSGAIALGKQETVDDDFDEERFITLMQTPVYLNREEEEHVAMLRAAPPFYVYAKIDGDTLNLYDWVQANRDRIKALGTHSYNATRLSKSAGMASRRVVGEYLSANQKTLQEDGLISVSDAGEDGSVKITILCPDKFYDTLASAPTLGLRTIGAIKLISIIQERQAKNAEQA